MISVEKFHVLIAAPTPSVFSSQKIKVRFFDVFQVVLCVGISIRMSMSYSEDFESLHFSSTGDRRKSSNIRSLECWFFESTQGISKEALGRPMIADAKIHQ